VVRPTEQQRAGLEALQMTTMGMAQLVMASCPAEQPAGPVARLGVETERITFMLFAVKTTGAAFSSFYSSLSDEQKAAFDKMAQPQQ
jgi:LTXXQ motif family protein